MGKLFGTDGIRGIANKELTPELSYKTGLAAAELFNKIKADENKDKPQVIIGRDTRISGSMIECAIAAGLCAGGCDVLLAGIVPTPAVAFLTRGIGCAAGIMISASHNPSEDNGIKIFNGKGYKLSDEYENYIEEMIKKSAEIKFMTHGRIGTVSDVKYLKEKYTDHVAAVYSGRGNEEEKKSFKIIIDCANGSASKTAREIFTGQGFENFKIMNSTPDGININNDCGSTHMKNLVSEVVSGKYSLGIAFDGDADRCLLVDETGKIINGDEIICLIANDLKANGKLHGDTLTVTKLSNIGLHKYAREHDIKVEITDVGDRYVLENMLEKSISVGGEQSGHIILPEYATTGDGQITAVVAANIIASSGKSASENIASLVKMYPQVERNIRLPQEMKAVIMKDEDVLAAVKDAENVLSGDGRVLLRPSGTEALIRIMIEGEALDEIKNLAEKIEAVIQKKLG